MSFSRPAERRGDSILRYSLLTILLFGRVTAAAEPTEWGQWRGPSRDCRIADDRVWPRQLDELALVQKYRVSLGPGYSGPVLTSDTVFVTETVDKTSEIVRALRRDNGEELWKAEWPGAMSVPFFAAANGSWIRSTPVCDGQAIYVAGMRDVLVALNVATGKELWRTDFTKEFGTDIESFGCVCSPLLDNGLIYIQTAGGLACVRTDSGAVVWRGLREEGGMMGGAFSSPVIAEIAGKRQLVVQTRSRLVGVEMGTGEELWGVEVDSFRGMNIVTPVVLGNGVFTSSYGGGAAFFDVSRKESQFIVREVWKKTVEAYMSSPVIVDGRIYLHLRNQRFTCIDPAAGETLWTTRPYGKYWSIAANGDLLLILDERGDLLLVEAGPEEFRQLSSRHVSETSTWAHLAVSGDQVFVRSLDALIAFQWSAATP